MSGKNLNDRTVHRKRRTPDRGSTTVVAVGLASVSVVLVGSLGVVAQGMSVRSRLDATADLAALAAAQHAVRAGPDAACEQARETAKRDGATLEECVSTLYSANVKVVVSATMGVPGLVEKKLHSEAVAGVPRPWGHKPLSAQECSQ